MKRKIVLPIVLAVAASIAAFIGCSEDSEPTSPKKNEDIIANTNDQTMAIVYSYEEFSTGDEVSILNDDTTKISVDKEFAAKADSLIPEAGNILVIWDKIENEPYYLRVSTVQEDSSRYTIKVEKASPFDAIPSGDYELSSEIYIDPNAEPNGGKLSPEAFYNKESKTYHPFLIKSEPNPLQDNEESIVGIDLLEKHTLAKTLEEKSYVDLRDVKLQSGSEDWTIIDINTEFHPGIIAIPGLGKTIGDYQGSWLDAFGGIEKLSKAMEKNGEKNPDGSPIKAYVRMDTLRFQSKLNFHLSWTTDWGIKGFEFYATASQDVYLSDIGLGLGAGFSGDKQLTSFEGKGFTFWVYGVPVYIKIVPNLFFKYGMEAYGLMDYRVQYHKHSEGRAGLTWKSGQGVNVIQDGHTEESHNEVHNFKQFVNNTQMVLCGKANAGIYLRVAALLYNVIGPTAGIGFRLDFDTRVGTASSYDDNGNWTGKVELTKDSYVELDGALAVEAGAEVTILGHTLFSKAYDVYDITKFKFFRMPDDQDIPDEDVPGADSSSFWPDSSSGGIHFSSSSTDPHQKDGPGGTNPFSSSSIWPISSSGGKLFSSSSTDPHQKDGPGGTNPFTETNSSTSTDDGES